MPSPLPSPPFGAACSTVSRTPSPSVSPEATPAVPPLPVLSVLLEGSLSMSLARCVAVALLSNAPAALMVATTVIVRFDAGVGVRPGTSVQGKAVHPAPLTLVMVRFVGVSVTSTNNATPGPVLETTSVYVIDCPAKYGPAVLRVFVMATSTAFWETPPLPNRSLLLVVFGSNSAAATLAELSNDTVVLMLPVMLMVTLAPTARLGIVQGNDV